MPVGAECVFLGRSTLDLLYQVAEFPREDSKAMATRFLAQAGGPALNAAVTFAFLGGAAHLISAVGRAAGSEFVKAELRRFGVLLSDICDDEAFSLPVSSVVINAASGSRTIVNAPVLPRPEREGALPRTITSAPLLLTDGFYASECSGLLHGFHALSLIHI